MNLYREHFTCVEELQQQRESAESPRQLSHHLLWKLFQQLSDGSPLERSLSDTARMVFAVAEHPRLADRAVARQRRGQQAGQTAAAPKPILIDRLESQGIEKFLTHWAPLFSPGFYHSRLPMAEERQIIAHDIDRNGRHH